MFEYDRYDIGFTFEGTDIKEVDDYNFGSLSILEAVNRIPYFELQVSAHNNINKFLKVKDITLDYAAKEEGKKLDERSFKAPLGVESILRTGPSLIIKGWMTKWENFRTPNTRYLGSDIKAAIEKLKIRDKLEYKNNFQGQYFQINETNLQQCLSLCMAAASYKYWTIDRTSISLDEREQIKNKDKKSELYKIQDQGSVLLINTQAKPEMKIEDSEWFSGSSFGRGMNYCDIESREAYSNFLQRKKEAALGFVYSLEGFSEGAVPFRVGDQLENADKEHYPEVKSWVIASLYTTLSKGAVSTEIQYGGILKDA